MKFDKKGTSYRQAHDIVGKMVRECLDKGIKISSLTSKELHRYSPKLSFDFKNILNPKASVDLKKSYGGTGLNQVSRQLNKWLKFLTKK